MEYHSGIGLKALREVKNPANRFVLQLIVADEEKHRAVSHALAATLKGSLTWSKPEGSLEGEADDAAANAKLPAVTEEFINLEKDGIREYKTLVEGRRELLSPAVQDPGKLDDPRLRKTC